MLTLAVTLAAGLGSVCRYLIGLRTTLSTFWVNVSGSFLLGLVLGLAAHHGLDPDLALIVGGGFAGGFTTLSTWAWESIELALEGRARAAAANIVGSFAVGLLAAAAGFALALL